MRLPKKLSNYLFILQSQFLFYYVRFYIGPFFGMQFFSTQTALSIQSRDKDPVKWLALHEQTWGAGVVPIEANGYETEWLWKRSQFQSSSDKLPMACILI